MEMSGVAAGAGSQVWRVNVSPQCILTLHQNSQEHEQASNIHLNSLASCATATVVVRRLYVLRSMKLMRSSLYCFFQGGIMVQHTSLMSLKTIGCTSKFVFSNPHSLKDMKDLFDSTYCIEQYSEWENPKLPHDVHVHEKYADHKCN